jgi:hypothetical protein
MPGPWTYPPELFGALQALGFAPSTDTPPAVTREAVDDLYRYELRRIRDRHKAGAVDRPEYLTQVIALRKKYWMLTLPLAAWERICRESR